jgi:hypothetical protein
MGSNVSDRLTSGNPNEPISDELLEEICKTSQHEAMSNLILRNFQLTSVDLPSFAGQNIDTLKVKAEEKIESRPTFHKRLMSFGTFGKTKDPAESAINEIRNVNYR